VEAQNATCKFVTQKANQFYNEEIAQLNHFFGASVNGANAAPIGASCFVLAKGSKKVAERILALPEVLSVFPDELVFGDVQWGQDRVDSPSRDFKAYSPQYPGETSGKRVRIYICDTGVDKNHPDLSGRVIHGPHYITSSPHDYYGHGTHVASIAAGKNYGIAPEAEIINLKVLDDSNRGSMSYVTASLSYATQQQSWSGLSTVDEPAIVSYSLSGSSSSNVNSQFYAANAAGMITVSAAGNGRTLASSRSPAGAGGNGINYGPITVGATDIYDRMAYYSNYGSRVDLLAPGSSIVAARANSVGTTTKSGTSMATPAVSGKCQNINIDVELLILTISFVAG